MSSAVIATAIKMLEPLPEPTQQQVLEHLREYIAELEDESEWNATFQRSQSKLVAAARRAKEQISQGDAPPLDVDQL